MTDLPRAAFPTHTADDWRRAATAAGKREPRVARWDGVELPSLVRADEAVVGPRHAASAWPRPGWTIAAELPFTDPVAWNAAAQADLADGLEMPIARFDGTGLVIDDDRHLEQLLAGIDLSATPIGFVAGANVTWMLRLVLEHARQRGVDLDALTGFVAGPLTREHEELLARSRLFPARLSVLLADGTVYREAGATATDELAFALASLAAQLRALVRAGVDLARLGAPPVLHLSAGMELAAEIARLRAARGLAAQLLGAFGVPAARAAVRILLVPSRRAASPLDPGNHLIRATLVATAGACGGADWIALDADPLRAADPDPAARRAARMVQHVLRVECGLDRVVDPTGGAHAVELLTDRIGRAAWSRMQEVERRGGLERAQYEGWIAEEVARAAARTRELVTERRRPIVGVSVSPNLGERVAPPPLRAASRWDAAPMAWRDAVAPTRDGAPFEALVRAAVDYAARTGGPPRVLVAQLGPSREYRARADWVAELFAVGGFEVAADREFATADEVARAAADYPVAVATSTDARYAADVPAVARALRASGAPTLLYVAGTPPDEATDRAWREAGVEGFVNAKANPHKALARLHERLGSSVDA